MKVDTWMKRVALVLGILIMVGTLIFGIKLMIAYYQLKSEINNNVPNVPSVPSVPMTPPPTVTPGHAGGTCTLPDGTVDSPTTEWTCTQAGGVFTSE